jgi:hypothetical protein
MGGDGEVNNTSILDTQAFGVSVQPQRPLSPVRMTFWVRLRIVQSWAMGQGGLGGLAALD